MRNAILDIEPFNEDWGGLDGTWYKRYTKLANNDEVYFFYRTLLVIIICHIERFRAVIICRIEWFRSTFGCFSLLLCHIERFRGFAENVRCPNDDGGDASGCYYVI